MNLLYSVGKMPYQHLARCAGQSASRKLQPEWRDALEKRYGAQAATVQHAEAFEIAEYGRHRARKRFANSSRFFPSGDSLLALNRSYVETEAFS
jgi:hypothetical protein